MTQRGGSWRLWGRLWGVAALCGGLWGLTSAAWGGPAGEAASSVAAAPAVAALAAPAGVVAAAAGAAPAGVGAGEAAPAGAGASGVASGAGVGVEVGLGFEEEFAWSRDREEALKQLVPGTEDYYYFHCLQHQNLERYGKVEEVLAAWVKRHGYTQRVWVIKNRQALLGYGANAAGSLEQLRQRLGVQFNHARETSGPGRNLPTGLDGALIGREALTRAALQRYGNTQGFEDGALEWVSGMNLDADRRRHLLSRLTRPDVPGLVKLVAADLGHPTSGGFGSLGVHGAMTLEQMTELAKLRPELVNQEAYVRGVLSRLRPSEDVDWRQDPVERGAYLDRLWAYVSGLAPVHNGLKSHVLGHRLALDRELGAMSRARFVEYVKLPRRAGWVNPRWLEQGENRRYVVEGGMGYGSWTGLGELGGDLGGGVGDEEGLVRGYLEEFLAGEADASAWEPYVRDTYLRSRLAESKILRGLGDPERWASLLSPGEFQALRERVEVSLLPTNKRVWGAREAVSVGVGVKNVEKLLVKVYRLNAGRHHRETLREIETDVALDGLVANEERVEVFEASPLRRVERVFTFPGLSEPGVYVVDLIGNGLSSRVLLRKGRLRCVSRTSAAGQALRVLDEGNRAVADATVWLGGREYRAGEGGEVVVPFSAEPGLKAVVLGGGGVSTLTELMHEGERYELTAGMYVDRESLVSRQVAKLAVRARLSLNGTPISIKALEGARLSAASEDRDGVVTTRDLGLVSLSEDRELEREIQTPARLRRLTLTLSGRVGSLSLGREVELSETVGYEVNEVEGTEAVQDLFLLPVKGGWVVEVLGRTGEARGAQAVNLELKHRDFRDPVHASCQTDAKGRVSLGSLEGIAWVKASDSRGLSRRWSLPVEERSRPGSVHGLEGEELKIPYTGEAGVAAVGVAGVRPRRESVSLLELRGGSYAVDRFDAMSVGGGYLTLSGLGRGDYELRLKELGVRLEVRVTRGVRGSGWLLGSSRLLEERNPRPLEVESVGVEGERLVAQLRQAGPGARVHVFATRYLPAFSAAGQLGRVRDPEPYRQWEPAATSAYVEGRDIGDEYRYILDRRYATKTPGNMLARPGLLLSPWSVRETQTGRQDAQAGDEFARAGAQERGGGGRGQSARGESGVQSDASSLDFLGREGAVALNLKADKDGRVALPLAALGGRQHVRVVAVDAWTTASRWLSLEEGDVKFLDLRLRSELAGAKHYTQRRAVTALGVGEAFKVEDVGSSRFEVYDTLEKAYGLLSTLGGGDERLARFRFVLEWPGLDARKKAELYSQHASHELSFFVAMKDPVFFRQVVQPHLRNKREKTFMDRWLLEEDLSAYLEPWSYQRLNAAERALLGRRLPAEGPAATGHLRDLCALIPPNPERDDRLFLTALQAAQLDHSDPLGLEKAKQQAEANKPGRAPQTKRPVDLSADGAAFGRAAANGSSIPTPAASPAPAPGADRPMATAKRSEEMQRQARDVKRESLMGKKASGKAAPADELAEGKPGEAAALEMEAAADDSIMFMDAKRMDADLSRRGSTRQLYRKLEATREWAENHYYHEPIERQAASLIPPNPFWLDYAAHPVAAPNQPAKPFLSPNLTHAASPFAQALLALAVLDLPFKAQPHTVQVQGNALTFTAASPALIFHQQLQLTPDPQPQAPVLVSQNFFRHGDRYRTVRGERVDKHVTDEFLTHVVYGCQVVVTNPTSSSQKLDVLLQIPHGAIPVLNSQPTRTLPLRLEPYATRQIEHHFYFPLPGEFPHYPVQVARDQRVLAAAPPFTLKVLLQPSRLDPLSWDHVSQNAAPDEVLDFLDRHNPLELNLERVAWRMRDPAFFARILQALDQRHVYNHTLWSYSILHNHLPALRQYLQHCDAFVAQCGPFLRSQPLTLDPVLRRQYEHLEYSPLVNARAHPLGRQRQIVNERVAWQYRRLLDILAHKPAPEPDDLMALTYHLLLQDRVPQARAVLARVDPQRLATRIQHDYFLAYTDLFSPQPQAARQIADRYANYPVDRWRLLFAQVAAQLDEAQGQAPPASDPASDPKDPAQAQARLAATEPALDLALDGRTVRVTHQNLKSARVNLYAMDIELLFSRSPFVHNNPQAPSQFASVQPNHSLELPLRPDQPHTDFPLPPDFHNRNVLIEVQAAGITRSLPSYAHALNVQIIESYGQLKVTHLQSLKPLPQTYIKVYARLADGSVRFYKDGYTDLRGRFDYASLNTGDLDSTQRLAILISHDQHGSIVREAQPPKP